MRQIKFRGKRVNNGQWIEGYYGESFREISSDIKTSYIVEMNRRPKGHDIHKETVGQFTGLTDKNGREIYEGDIVSAFSNINKISDPHLSTSDPTYSNKYVEFIRGVFSLSSLEFPNGGCGVLDHYVGAMSKDLEIIGNIHDNPELLK